MKGAGGLGRGGKGGGRRKGGGARARIDPTPVACTDYVLSMLISLYTTHPRPDPVHGYKPFTASTSYQLALVDAINKAGLPPPPTKTKNKKTKRDKKKVN